MATFSTYLKNIFWVLILLQFAPPLIRQIKTQYTDLLEPKTKVGVIDIKGGLSSATTIVKDLKKLFENDEVKAIVLKIECPGGSAGTAQTVFNEIKLLKSQYSNKYVVALIENIAASGGYYIACAANYIIASPAAFIGSIGAYIPHPYFKEFIEYHKIKYEFIKSGAYKTTGSPFTELTPAQRNELQGLTDNVYQQFTKDVAAQRPKLSANINQWADGKIFTGQQALELKLIDALGSPSTAIKVIRDNAHIKGKIEWVKPAKKTGLLSSLMNPDEDAENDSYLKTFMDTALQVAEERYSLQIK